MPLKFCNDCDDLFDKSILVRGRCPSCALKYERARGTRQQRGAGGREYDAFARYIRKHRLRCMCTGQCGSKICRAKGYCGFPWGDSNNPITVGHIIPRSQGGDNSWGNLRPECRACNLRKGSRN